MHVHEYHIAISNRLSSAVMRSELQYLCAFRKVSFPNTDRRLVCGGPTTGLSPKALTVVNHRTAAGLILGLAQIAAKCIYERGTGRIPPKVWNNNKIYLLDHIRRSRLVHISKISANCPCPNRENA